MSGNNKVASPSSVQSNNILVPLYIYPSPGAWNPLFRAVQKYHDITFIIIVNPNNGPGGLDYKKDGEHDHNAILLPDHNYKREILRLNSYVNVKTVGYVSTNWAQRELRFALSDVAIYSNWSKYPSSAPGLGVKGIFLDETVTQYNNSGAFFLGELSSFIRSEENFGPDALIIHNPGALPDPRYMSYCSIAVIFEDSYSKYQQKYNNDLLVTVKTFQKAANVSRDAIACIIHSLTSPNEIFPGEARKKVIQSIW
ncbi:Spherulin-4 [Erysiphe neolycopersici]|uniref:Spherulin-4 n=1 Tax=Erysiphe neolycopersici TaxID=212602 RepID=A0A420HX02_9PEZI|nr:Spherulin-4 [Erysiphe neolycopersici]